VERKLKVCIEKWPLRRPFRISRGSKVEAEVVVVELSNGNLVGRGECVPYPRYGETVDGVVASIDEFSSKIEAGLSRLELNQEMVAGAARNALDTSLWDLEAKKKGKRVWDLIGCAEPKSVVTAETIGLDTVKSMAEEAYRLRDSPLIKVKLDNQAVIPRLAAIRGNAPLATLIVDPNEGWSISDLFDLSSELETLGVAMIEQPLPAEFDEDLLDYSCSIPICADESCHTTADLPNLKRKYNMINIKLDKTGGLTEALILAAQAKKTKLKIMLGCMIGTSLAMAPSMLLTEMADFVDLDGPLLLRNDRNPGLEFKDGKIFPPNSKVWG